VALWGMGKTRTIRRGFGMTLQSMATLSIGGD
jgi:hypothetical protein